MICSCGKEALKKRGVCKECYLQFTRRAREEKQNLFKYLKNNFEISEAKYYQYLTYRMIEKGKITLKEIAFLPFPELKKKIDEIKNGSQLDLFGFFNTSLDKKIEEMKTKLKL